jgi:AraC family transcriptional regulator
MVLHEFPDLNWLKGQAESRFEDRKAVGGNVLPTAGWPSVILHTKASNICRDNIRGPFSIFTNINGASAVTIDKRRVVVRDKFFFVSNQDQHYTLEVDKTEKAETFNVHFGEFFANEVLTSISASPSGLLETNTTPSLSFALHNRLYRRSDKVEMLVGMLQKNENHNNLSEEECLTALMIELLKEDEGSKRLIYRIDSVRKSTREEIFKRLTIVTDYIYSSYDRDMSLDELAGVACLSKFHFLRLFKITFQCTPHQFITNVRMTHAKEMLLRKRNAVKEIGRTLGFKDSSSFSRAFFKQYGVYPTQVA